MLKASRLLFSMIACLVINHSAIASSKKDAPLQKLSFITRLPQDVEINFLSVADQLQTLCVALAIYKEARGESERDKILVAKTIHNRHVDLKESECSVISKPHQFPWVNKLNSRWKPSEAQAWTDAQYIAFMDKFSDKYPNPSCRISYFNTVMVNSHRKLLMCAIVSRHHIYYNLRKPNV